LVIMSRFVRIFLGWSGLVIGAASAGPASAQAIDAFEIAGWRGAAYTDPRTRGFSHCVLTAGFGDVSLRFLLDQNDDFRIEISAEDWRLRSGADYVASLMIDHRESIQVIASARSETLLAIEIGPDEDIVKELRAGQFLRVLAEHIGLSFSLSGTGLALPRLKQCVSDHAKRAPAAR
jgi:hypothetical protein